MSGKPTGRYHLYAQSVREAFEAVAAYRKVELTILSQDWTGTPRLGQGRWFAWRARYDLTDRLPESFQDVLDAVTSFTDPVLATHGNAGWDPARRTWTKTVATF